MDIFKEKQRQQYLILVAVGMIIVAFGILSYGGSFFDKNVLAPDVQINKYRKPIINWAILESPELKELQIP